MFTLLFTQSRRHFYALSLFLSLQDVSRVINCNDSAPPYNDTPDICYDEVFNFLTSFDIDALPSLLLDNEVPQLENTTFSELIDTLIDNSTVPKQQVLFDLPYYYFGK